MKKNLFSLFFTLFFIGCTSTQPKISVFTLTPPPADIKKEGALNIEVITPKSSKIYTDTKMVYSLEHITIDEYAYSRWSDSPQRIVQKNIAEGLRGSGVFGTVAIHPSKIAADYAIESDILDFRHTFEGNLSFASLGVRIYFLNIKEKSSKELLLTYKTPCKENSPKGFALAMDESLQGLRKDITQNAANLLP